MFFFSVASFLILGITTLWSVRIMFGDQRRAANGLIPVGLSIVGWVFIMLGLTSLVSPIGMLLVLAVLGMAVARFRHSERRTLLWLLSIAAERGIPFSPTVRAFAARRSDEMARRALALADLLDAGVPLTKALKASKNPLSPETELMVRLSADTNTASTALRASRQFNDETEDAWSPIFGQIAYLAFVIFATVGVFAFLIVKVMPTMQSIFDDFEVDLPAVSQLSIAVARLAEQYGFVFLLGGIYLVVVLFIGGIFYSCGRVWLPPPFSWLFGRTDKPTMLRGLAICVQQELPMHEAFRRLARDYPVPGVQRKLAECSGATAVGADWCRVLREHELITEAEAGVLRAAIPTGNLVWALRELAEVSSQRVIDRAKVALNIISAVSIILIAVPIAVFALGYFMPLVKLINEAANV